MENLLTTKDLTEKQIYSVLDLAKEVKSNPNKYSSKLDGKCIILIFEKTSTRTRISFENGMYQLGGNVIYLDWKTANFHLGALKDEIICISRYIDLIMARVHEHQTLEIMTSASTVPVINGLSDIYHPCQALADLMTIREKFGSFENVSVAYIGDGNNVCNSLLIGCIKLGIPILVATPEEYKPHEQLINWVKKQKNGHYLTLSNDPKEVVREASVVYTDTFVSMGQEGETEKRLRIFKPYQVNLELLSHARNDPYIMHCLPAHRGVEITDKVLDSDRSIVFEQAENRLHLQKALMLKLLNAI